MADGAQPATAGDASGTEGTKLGHDYPSTLAGSAEELGAWMRTVRERANCGLRERADESMRERHTYRESISKSSLARYEAGRLPAMRYAHDLDVLYSADGWIELSMSALWKPRWEPWKGTQPEAYHVFRWPAAYRGAVWFDVRPRRDLVGRAHRVDVRWGPWRVTLQRDLPADGVTFWTGKDEDRDGVAPAIELESSLPVHVLFGARLETAGDNPVDIRDLWLRIDR